MRASSNEEEQPVAKGHEIIAPDIPEVGRSFHDTVPENLVARSICPDVHSRAGPESQLAGLCDDRARRHPPTRWGRLLTSISPFSRTRAAGSNCPAGGSPILFPKTKGEGKYRGGRLP